MSCGKCCSNFWIFTENYDEVERFNKLDTGDIEVIEIKENLWKIMFKISCRHLGFKEDGRACCLIYNDKRPQVCPEYPRNFLGKEVPKVLLEHEKGFCPLLKKILSK